MKTKVKLLFSLLFLFFSCDKTDDLSIQEPDQTITSGYIKTIDFSSSVDNDIFNIEDFDVENGYLYFIYGVSIYRINLNSEENSVEFIIEDDIDWPMTLKVINNNLYYQGDFSWGLSQDLKHLDLNSMSEGVQSTYPIVGFSRSQFCKDSNKLYYLSSEDGFSPINNIYEFQSSSTHQLIATDEFLSPKNMRMKDQYLYFSSNMEIRRFDLNNPTGESSIVYTVPEEEIEGNIIGFDIYHNVIYYTLTSSNKLFSKDLDDLNEQPHVLRVNDIGEDAGYGKIIINEGILYVKKIGSAQLEVFEI
ncbi:MAG: hypothetical protein Wins2KO_22880 [Winogradskyella sp.]